MLSVVIMCCVVAAVTAQGNFGTSLSSTRCNKDPNQGQVSDPCNSLYDAVCQGSFCQCSPGFVEHPTLHRCVPDRGLNTQPQQQPPISRQNSFDDLPFDYVPNQDNNNNNLRTTTTLRPRQPPSNVVGNTPCTDLDNPCLTMHNAVCNRGYCTCPRGTQENRNTGQCDHLHDDNDHSHHHGDDDDENRYTVTLFNGSPATVAGWSIMTTSVVLAAILAKPF